MRHAKRTVRRPSNVMPNLSSRSACGRTSQVGDNRFFPFVRSPVSMESCWNRIRPFVLSFGMHAAVLLLLVADFSQRPVAHAHAERGTLINASLVAWPPVASGVAGARPPELHAAPTPQTAAVKPPAKAAPKPQKATPSEQASAAKQEQPATQQTQDVASANVALNPDQDDPYAQMRRERAEAERRYQMQQEALRRIADAHAQQAQASVPTPTAATDASAASTSLPFGSMDSDQGGANAFLAGLQFNAGGAAMLAQGQPWAQCQADAATAGNDGADALAWMDCLLDPWQTAPEGPDPKGATSWPIRL